MNTTTSGDEEIDHTENTSMDLQLKAGSNSIDTGTIESSTSTSTVVAEQRSKVLTNQNTYLSASASHSLPWSWRKEHSAIFVSANGLDKSVRPGEFVLRALFAEFTSHVEKKTDAVLSPDAVEKPLSKVLQRGEDPAFDQLLTALGSVAEHCLPSLLRTLFAWHERQMNATKKLLEQKSCESQSKSNAKQHLLHESFGKNEARLFELLERRDLCVEYVFCLALIEVLKQLSLHPGHEPLLAHVEQLAFAHFKSGERSPLEPNAAACNMVADLYAEVLGVLAQSRFQLVRTRFSIELQDLRSKEPTAQNSACIVSLLMGMKFFRIKMVPIEQFEASLQFMSELAGYFLQAKDKHIKHALAGLLVEILLPVAATVKNEVNVPCLKHFVELLFAPTLDLCTKKKHSLAIFPLVTCLLCVSQKTFFLQNWHYFLALCLSNLKNRDPKMSRVALESLYRLLWVYMIRLKCESNSATQSRLHSIVASLFPKGSKAVVPRDTPLNIFVKIIQFVAQERLEFAMNEIVFELLSVGRPIKIILTPERMSIGLRAFLVVADSLQQKEGEPPMPRTCALPSGNVQRVKKTFLNKMLTDPEAKAIGVHVYYAYVRKSLNDILRALDAQIGRPLSRTVTTIGAHKELHELLGGERKPKIDLFRTCVAAVPRLLPEGMSRSDLIDLLCRLTVHVDDELNALAFQALQNLVNDLDDWKEVVFDRFVTFVVHQVPDTQAHLFEHTLRIFLQLLCTWKQCLQAKVSGQAAGDESWPSNRANESKLAPSLQRNGGTGTTPTGGDGTTVANEEECDRSNNAVTSNTLHNHPLVLHKIEALCVVALCSARQPTRRLSVQILKEARAILNYVKLLSRLSTTSFGRDRFESFCSTDNEGVNGATEDGQTALLDVMDRAARSAFEACAPVLRVSERASLASAIGNGIPIDLQWLSERNTSSWTMENVPTNETISSASPVPNEASIKETLDLDLDVKDATPIAASSSNLLTTNPSTNFSNVLQNNKEAKDATVDVIDRPNAWNLCLIHLISQSNGPCPTTLLFAYHYSSERMQYLFQQLDERPSGDNRASALLRGATSAPRKPPIERPLYMCWWKTYLLLVCQIAPSIEPAPFLPIDPKITASGLLLASASIYSGSTVTGATSTGTVAAGTPTTATNESSSTINATILSSGVGDSLMSVNTVTLDSSGSPLNSAPSPLSSSLSMVNTAPNNAISSSTSSTASTFGPISSSAPLGSPLLQTHMASIAASSSGGSSNSGLAGSISSIHGSTTLTTTTVTNHPPLAPLSISTSTTNAFLLQTNRVSSSVQLLRNTLSLMRNEQAFIRLAAVQALSHISPQTLPLLLDEIRPYVRECIDRKQENMRRRKRREILRNQLGQLLLELAERGTLADCGAVLEQDAFLCTTLTEYVDGLRTFLEHEPPIPPTLTGHFGSSSLSLSNSSAGSVSGIGSIPGLAGIANLTGIGNKDALHFECAQRTQFLVFVWRLIKSFSVDTRAQLFSLVLRKQLFHLFAAEADSATAALFRPWSAGHTGSTGNVSSGATGSATPHTVHSHSTAGGSTYVSTTCTFGCTPNTDCIKCRLLLNERQLSASQLAAQHAMSAVLCCGPVFSDALLAEGSVVFRWILGLVAAGSGLRALAQQTIVLLLEYNPDASWLLDWLLDCCYTRPADQAETCFVALATVFAIREYPCDQYISIVNLALLYACNGNTRLQQTAVRLLQLLHYRFFDSTSAPRYIANNDPSSNDNATLNQSDHCTQTRSPSPPTLVERQATLPNETQFVRLRRNKNSAETISTETTKKPITTNDPFEALFAAQQPHQLPSEDPTCDIQLQLSTRLAELHPQITMAMFSEITYRFQTARPGASQRLLRYLIPWLANIQLVDGQTTSACNNSAASEYSDHHRYHQQQHLQPPLNSDNDDDEAKEKAGWGSLEATEMVLNNLFYMTVKFCDVHQFELDRLWIALAIAWPSNVRVIARYLFIVTALSPDQLLTHSKHVFLCLARVRPAQVLDQLMIELQTLETLHFTIERTETPPFYRISNARRCNACEEEGHSISASKTANVDATKVIESLTNNKNDAATEGDHNEENYDPDTILNLDAESKCDQPRKTHDRLEIDIGADQSNDLLASISSVYCCRHYNAGVLHTKRHSTEACPNRSNHHVANNERTHNERRTKVNERRRPDTWHVSMKHEIVNTTSYSTESSPASNNRRPRTLTALVVGNNRKCFTPQPFPFPMPEYGGYYAPLSEYLGPSGQSAVSFYRCNLATVFICDLLLDGLQLDWSAHLPLLLHVAIIGLDHVRPLVHSHCRQLLINILCSVTPKRHLLSVARITLHNHAATLSYGLSVPSAEDLPTHVDFTKASDDTIDNCFSSGVSSRKSSLGRNRSFALAEMLAPEAGSWRVADHGQLQQMSQQSQTTAVGSLLSVKMNGDDHDESLLSTEQFTRFGSCDKPIRTSTTTISSHSGNFHLHHGRESHDDAPPTSASVGEGLTKTDHANGEQLLLALLHYLTSRPEDKTLWACEDITAKVWSITSAQQLSRFTRHLLRALDQHVPGARVPERWAEIALQLALSCSSRHLAGRCLQVFRAIGQPINARILTDILSRLVETVADPNDDMQGYVTELMLTLDACVEPLDNEGKVLTECVRQMFQSNHDQEQNRSKNDSELFGLKDCQPNQSSRIRSRTDCDLWTSGDRNHRNRSRSVNSLPDANELNSDFSWTARCGSTLMSDDAAQLQAQLLLTAVSLLESDYEHEYLLALKLLDRILKHVSLQTGDFETRVCNTLLQCRWHSFAGLHALLLKGLTNNATFETSVSLLQKLTPLLHTPLLDPCGVCNAFPFHVIALLPYMLLHYDEPNTLCVRAAQQIAAGCAQASAKLDNLATVMSLYSRKAFSKQSQQWTKCVVKYLYDAQPQPFAAIISFLVEVLEKGPPALSVHVISTLNCIIHYVELTDIPGSLLNNDLNKLVLKYVDTPAHKDTLAILKLVVARSSTLAAAPQSHHGTVDRTTTSVLNSGSCSLGPSTVALGTTYSAAAATINYSSLPNDHSTTIIASNASFCEPELAGKRELPGRTLDFTFDLTQTPIVGRKYIVQANQHPSSSTSIVTTTSGITSNNTVSSISSTTTTINDNQPICNITSIVSNNPYATQSSNTSVAAASQEFPTSSSSLTTSFRSAIPSILSSNTSSNITLTNSIERSPLRDQNSANDLSLGNHSINSDLSTKRFGDIQSLDFLSTAHNLPPQTSSQPSQPQVAPSTCTARRSLSYTCSFSGENVSNWRRPWLCQVRVRDRLLGVLGSFGQRVGLPKSPSVVFSQSSDNIEPPSSNGSISEDPSATTTATGNESRGQAVVASDASLGRTASAEQFGLFKEFDFLEYELGSQEDESMDNFNWGVRRRSLSSLAGCNRPITVSESCNVRHTDRCGLTLSSSATVHSSTSLAIKREAIEANANNSSDDDAACESPLFNYNNELNLQELSPFMLQQQQLQLQKQLEALNVNLPHTDDEQPFASSFDPHTSYDAADVAAHGQTIVPCNEDVVVKREDDEDDDDDQDDEEENMKVALNLIVHVDEEETIGVSRTRSSSPSSQSSLSSTCSSTTLNQN